MIHKEYILTCLGEETTELLEEILKSDINNLKANENFIKELADVIGVSQMFFNTFYTFHWHSFEKLPSSNIWEKEDSLQNVLFLLNKHIFKALRFGVDNRNLDNQKSHKDMILECIQKKLLILILKILKLNQMNYILKIIFYQLKKLIVNTI